MVEDLELLKILELRYCFSLVNWNFTHKKPSRAKKNNLNEYSVKYELQTKEEDTLTPLLLLLDNERLILRYAWKNSIIPKIIKEYPLKIGKKLPDIPLINKDNRTSLYAFRGKITVINWWSTSCLPCVQEIPGFNKLVDKYPDIAFISIVKDKENLQTFLEKHPFKYAHYFGNKKITELFIDMFPRNIVLSKDGTITYNMAGGNKDMYLEIEKAILSIKH